MNNKPTTQYPFAAPRKPPDTANQSAPPPAPPLAPAPPPALPDQAHSAPLAFPSPTTAPGVSIGYPHPTQPPPEMQTAPYFAPPDSFPPASVTPAPKDGAQEVRILDEKVTIASPPTSKPIPFWVWAIALGSILTLFIMVMLTVIFAPWGSEKKQKPQSAGATSPSSPPVLNYAQQYALALRTWTQMNNIFMVMKAHEAQNGQLPDQLEDLVRSQGFPASFLKDAWLRPLEYDPEAGTITSLGPDGQRNTEDDLVRSGDDGPELPPYYQELQQRIMQSVQQPTLFGR